ncbi:DMT family transporter [Thermomonospora umbrina]|uniref:Threonine/homoserine efflux transporter RhtA n=1 Tax=Thermomonospora umbrina TaxID=111806 RepID=A0A3D9SQH0_9ACTN|nr:EamA family transporter [Thermomonospora umbrina]REE98212.1 threonine/homoserine efflux transporter RhtA [Thermomonospora umbrina]
MQLVLTRPRLSLGVTLCLVSAAGFGMSAIFAKETYASGTGVHTMLTLRFVIAALLFWLLVALRAQGRRPASRTFPRGRVLLHCVGLGAVGYACQAAFYFGALARISGSLAALLLYTYPPLVAGVAVALRRERMDARKTVALTCSVGGVLLLLGGGVEGGAASGVLMALAAGATYAIYLTVADGLPDDLDLYVLSAIVCTGAAVSLSLAGLVTGGLEAPAEAAGWLWTALLAVFATFLPIVCLLAGMRAVGASTAAIVSYAEPAVAVASTALVYGESLTVAQAVGGVVVLSTVAILRTNDRQREAVSSVA